MIAAIENKFSKFLAIGLFIITVLVVAGPVADPVNTPKMAALGTLSFGLIPFLIVGFKQNLSRGHFANYGLVLVFSILAVISMLGSNSPLSQNLYGVFGRNTGVLTYISFTLIYLAASIFQSKQSHKYILHSLLFAGIVNIVYGFIAEFIGDPIPWTNIYNALLGTFGNPNFSGAFYGLTSSVFLGYMLGYNKEFKFKILFGILMASSLYCVLLTKTKQGLLVSALTISVIIFIYIRTNVKKKMLQISFVGGFAICFIFSVLGMLQKGPFASYLYKESVSLRGSYWNAAFEAGKANLLTGVGFDSLGDWYRRSRSEKAATWLPGPEVITNSAHNYYLDIFSNGGILLLVAYISFTIIGFVNALRIVRRMQNFDYVGSVLVAVFIGFQAQAVISIAQIGLAVWGWALAGLLFSYARLEDGVVITKKPKKSMNTSLPFGVLSFISMSLGFILSIPAFSADAKWMNATKSQSLQKVEAALVPNYFNPLSSVRMLNAIVLLEKNAFHEEAHAYAIKLTEFNPDFFEGWQALYLAAKTTEYERSIALKEMRRLDPLNKRLDKFTK